MILEHEVIEQIEEEPGGRPLPWICDLLRSHGCTKPMLLLQDMWRAGHLVFTDADMTPCKDREIHSLFHNTEEPADIHIHATDSASQWVHGN